MTMATMDHQSPCRLVEAINANIMVVDDVSMNISVVCAHLRGEGYERFIKVCDPSQAIATLYQEEPDLLLLDMMMPVVSGLDILRVVRADPKFSHLPVLVLTASDDRQLRKAALEAGATDFLLKPIDPEDLIPRVRNSLVLKQYQDSLEQQVRQRTRELEESRVEVVHCLARAAEHRDEDTGNHVLRVGKYVGLISRTLGIDDATAQLYELAAILHDVGKIGISDSILRKPGKYTAEEFSMMQEHCALGQAICDPTASVGDSHQDVRTKLPLVKRTVSPLLTTASVIASTHHEKWDGSGYPWGLKGEEIPLAGRITAVADVFDALCSKRSYKEAFPLDKCFGILEEGRGKHFDPVVLDAFFAAKEQILFVHHTFGEA
ncbi:HD domain-containing phosphohydrolase [Rubripirellula reticaptiva]|uniref:Cyclic di-GMP phosphodiesterase response regulator RpfG n=1 Tax=Rubripirellula reticaptiva TaxID=2528013 RepID=A0A5C6EP35_9BACT|nr:HD domain-containing phosphohydrolase [Rubripirellula reticaptiva]TWU49777.1 Cyclic di-GMP phosphodiesterase response regulator RpfG [Rubripirellula reticaptiva]